MTKERYSVLIALFALLVLYPVKSTAQNIPPIADAGLSRYAAQDPVVLDGTGSYDLDNSGPLSYAWRQIAGPPVVIIDANTATPTVSGFTQTDVIQECEFELVVSDGELTSLPDTVKIIIVPDFGTSRLQQENPPFDPDKPTVIYFGGGDCITGRGSWGSTAWAEKANIISFSYGPDRGGVPRTYYKYGDMIIVYLSSVALDYKQPIQTMGYSTGGQPAIDVGIRLNLTYRDARYAVNHFISFDATSYCRDYSESITAFLGSSVDGEQCWADAYVITTERPGWAANPPHYEANYPPFYENVLNVWFPTATGGWGQRHRMSYEWYKNSLMLADLNNFNHGVVAGAYWSVVGPGKNLQLASTPDAQSYKFQWYGDAYSGYMDYYDEPNHPGRLPEPVTLVGPIDVGDPNGAVLTCEESENAIGYQLLFGPDPYRVMDYNIISDTPAPPNEIITTLPFEETWWTVKVRDQYGSTIYADPMYIDDLILSLPMEENYQRLIAHWRLDEAEGDIAADSAGENNAVVFGDAFWQPDAGMIDGALAFDGIDDYVSTDFVLNPADGPFSVFAWIKGGAPGQVVLSQIGGANWLLADTSEGNLMTELRFSGGRVVGPLLWSQTVITDGDWHRVGFVWDGSNRILYADGVEVARDTQTGLGSSDGGLYIGTGKGLGPASFFSGLIDDVRIYNRAITP